MEIYVYKGEWGLPSIDYDCLRVMMFIKLTKAPVEIKVSNSVFWSPTGTFPYLQTNGTKIAGYLKIIHYLNSQGFDIEKGEGDNKVEFDDGYVELLRQDLYPYFMYILWSPQNIDQTRSLYAKRTQFPLNFFTPKKYVQKTESMIKHLYNFSLEDPIASHNIADMALKAKQAINLLEERLKGKSWLMGDAPSIADCQVYAFLAIILNHTLPNNTLQVHAQQCPNLIKYVQRITKEYFATEGFNSNTNKQTSSTGNEKPFYTGEEPDEDPKEKRKRIILSALVATVSMVTYAVFKGILHLPYRNENGNFLDYINDDDDGDDDDD